MKLQFKEQDFQVQAAKAVTACFEGQPFRKQACNSPLRISEKRILENIRWVQVGNGLEENSQLEKPTTSGYHLTIEMETGTGKTYTYIRTMYELHRQYGWSKFIIIVPGIAIREGVYKSFEITQDHFRELYGHSIRPFIYDSTRLQDIGHFAADSRISVMIINIQAFSSADARRIYQEQDQLGSRRPVDIIAQAHPVMIIDEPQSSDGAKTLQGMQDFNPLCTLRYSATHRSAYNKIFRLDALDAYRQRLVKQIQVKGIQLKSAGATGFLYLERIILSTGQPPVAVIEFEKRTGAGVQKVRRKAVEGADLYELSGRIPAYQNRKITEIDGYLNRIIIGGEDVRPGDMLHNNDEPVLRRIQIRETILSHLQKEQRLFEKGIKVLSLFFVDAVEKYKMYNVHGDAEAGTYAQIFEEEYALARTEMLQNQSLPSRYRQYLEDAPVQRVHAGYFSIDRKNRMVNPSGKRGSLESDDISAYDLIMKDKERLLSFEEPARFLFSHSALKEGWDNPNVFQICALKHADGGSQTRRRQEVGRGLRLCVNNRGMRQDYDVLGEQVHEINKLTVIASESYEAFAKGLQQEITATWKREPARVENERTITVSSKKIHPAALYEIAFDTQQLITNSSALIDRRLNISESMYEIKTGDLTNDVETRSGALLHEPPASAAYDIIGEIEALTQLTRKTIVAILQSIREEKFLLLHQNPEAFIAGCGRLINEAKAAITVTAPSSAPARSSEG
ncbi:DEAD/DEAH box helicase family protein [Chitinophaga cymbidii]|nr:DEAD/DEAH box helicase family protein [Chitinophaga cymbidii]